MSTDLMPFSELEKMAAVMGKSGMFGKSAEQIMSLMLIAQAEGKHPAIVAQEYDIIQGKAALNSRSALSRFQAAGGRIQWDKRSDVEATATFSHPQGGQVTITWDMPRAKQAGLAEKELWRKFPRQMLSARCVAEGVRICYPMCLNQMYVVEEVEDGFTERDVTPRIEPEPEKPKELGASAETVKADIDARTIQQPDAREELF